MFSGAMVDALVEYGHEADLLLSVWNPISAINGTKKATKVWRVEIENAPLGGAAYLRPFDTNQKADMHSLFDTSRLIFCEKILKDNKLLAELKAQKYDIGLAPPYDSCGLTLFHRLGIKSTALFSATPPTFFVMETLGIPAPPSFVTDGIAPISVSKYYTFKERFINAIQYYKTYFTAQNLFQDERKLILKYYPEAPTPLQLFRNASYFFVNHNELLDTGRPISGKVKFIGGIQLHHEDTAKKLDSKYDKLLARTPKGAVLFSFGTTASTNVVPKDVRNVFIETFKQFPEYTFIWKHDNKEDDEVELKEADNVFAEEWLPQKQLLADQRLKLFITHCGMNSFSEFTLHGVPVLTIPLAVDQHVNAASVVSLGIGLQLQKNNLTIENLHYILDHLLSKPSYKKNAEKLSNAVKSSPNKPRKTFIESVEFAAKFPEVAEYLQLPQFPSSSCPSTMATSTNTPAPYSSSPLAKNNLKDLRNWKPKTLSKIQKLEPNFLEIQEKTKPTLNKLDSLSEAKIRVYADGVFDLFHIGHVQQFAQIKQMLPGCYLIVGVVSDSDTLKYKGGKTVISEENRAAMVSQCRYVDEVYLNPPFYPTLEFVNNIKCDLVAHDAIPYEIGEEIDDCYLPFKQADRFLATERTPGVSTTDILENILKSMDLYKKRQKIRLKASEN
ncbi:unnamed protein product [Bursaphelenchus okinawaensis]|uniref:glucuronosyltransferase n=1 Tax=Bursaphelenchus okinawaensis TaxID=465554 RepID=A0A811LLT5_9BILA|nr:unnamed protein product [Bursaphelenchus okinawaensis]CAG9123790.1 unnamed protein product [Bursaphelenchus okinawaensis]